MLTATDSDKGESEGARTRSMARHLTGMIGCDEGTSSSLRPAGNSKKPYR